MNRSEIMRAVPSRHTSAERKTRAILRAVAPGYRLHRDDLPGKPDIAYVGRKLAIFVHGCFWHGHACKRGAREPKTNVDYWRGKIARNAARDERHRAALETMGWRALTVWECELADADAVATRLREATRAPKTLASPRASRAPARPPAGPQAARSAPRR